MATPLALGGALQPGLRSLPELTMIRVHDTRVGAADLSHIQALPPNTQVILAEDEEVLSVESQKEQCRKWAIGAILVKDSHRLAGSLETIKKAAFEVCAACGG